MCEWYVRHHMCTKQGPQSSEEGIRSLGLELQTVVSCLWVLGTLPKSFAKEASSLDY